TGQRLLKLGRISDAWMYFRAIEDPAPVAQAIDQYEPAADFSDELEEMIQLALYQRVNPAKGVQLMLNSHGMCNTVTALDQIYLELTAEQRASCAEIMVKQLYEDIKENIRRDVEQRTPMLPPDQSLSELLAGRLWLFEDDNYHTDVSHLNAIVRFARALEFGSDVLDRAVQLCQYGSRLALQLQYPGEAPFDTYYESHQHYFQIVADVNRKESLQFFQDRLTQAEEAQDKELIAYVLVDLLMRIKDFPAAIQVAETHLDQVNEQSGFSFTTLCEDTGNMEALQRHAQKNNNAVMYVAAKLQQARR
ncbi:MAG: hypothetical protein JKY95_02435, partial [Planctomycetaceae bacterium]|nr:hypothetical protein [Planctomycetaceae bacterium]